MTATATAVRDTAREVYLAIFEDFALDTREIADTFFEGSLPKARRCLDALLSKDLLHPPEDINGAAQGSARRGSYAALTWQANPTYDEITVEQAYARFDEIWPEVDITITTARKGNNRSKPEQKGADMAAKGKTAATKKRGTTKTATRKSVASKRTGSAGRKGVASKTTGKTADAGAKRAAAKQRDAEMTQTMLEMRANGDSWATIAAELSITPGKAQFLNMLHEVAEGNVPKITGRNDTELGAKLQKAREKADAYSSWGWLAARSGKPEGTIKALAQEQGWYEPKAENIAATRAAAKNGGKSATAKGTSTRGAAKKTPAGKGKASATKAARAKQRAKARRSSAKDPS